MKDMRMIKTSVSQFTGRLTQVLSQIGLFDTLEQQPECRQV